MHERMNPLGFHRGDQTLKKHEVVSSLSNNIIWFNLKCTVYELHTFWYFTLTEKLNHCRKSNQTRFGIK